MKLFERKPKSSRRTITITAILIGVAVISLLLRGGGTPEVVEEVIKKQISVQDIAKQDEVTSTLSASGTVIPRQYTVIRSLVQGTLEFVHPAGTQISAGQPLFNIRDDNVENSYFNALQNLQQTNLIADERVSQSRLALNSAEARANLAHNSYNNTVAQSIQLLANSQDSAIVSFNSAHNTLNQFYTAVSNGATASLEYKYRNVVSTNTAVLEQAKLQHLISAQNFLNLSSTVDQITLDSQLDNLSDVLSQTKQLSDITVILLQNTLGGIDNLASEKTSMANFQTLINTHTATILNSQNTLRNRIITNSLSVDQAQNQLELAEIELINAQISLSNAENSAALEKVIIKNQVDNAAYHFGNLSLVSPFTGTVLSTFVEAGQQVSVGQELLEVGNIDIVEIEVEVDTEFGAGLKQGDKVSINGIYQGFISEVEPVGSLASGKIGVTVQSENIEGFLVSGQIAEVEFNLTFEQPDLIIIPIKSATIEPASTYVFIVEDGKATKRNITLGRVFGSQVSVTAGLVEGDRLIIKNGVFISEGNEVEVVN